MSLQLRLVSVHWLPGPAARNEVFPMNFLNTHCLGTRSFGGEGAASAAERDALAIADMFGEFLSGVLSYIIAKKCLNLLRAPKFR